MIIISVIYSVTSFLIVAGIFFAKMIDFFYGTVDGQTTDPFFVYYTLIISLSCLLNPLVYIFRKQKLRSYIKCYLTCKRSPNVTEMITTIPTGESSNPPE